MPKFFTLLTILSLLAIHPKNSLPDSDRARAARKTAWPKLQNELKDKGLTTKPQVYIRLFKEDGTLEIWVKAGQQYRFFKSYNICAFSGGLGTKIKAGDYKSPEGFYTVGPNQLNPNSSYHLSINVGYPNKLETLKGYTGDQIMIHGICASNGCYAMTNDGIDDIYTIFYKAFEAGQQKIDVAIFPFRMDDQHMKTYKTNPSFSFWKTLKPGYDLFERNHVPPIVSVQGLSYSFKAGKV